MQGLMFLTNEQECKLTEEARKQGKLTVELARDLIVSGLSGGGGK